MLYSQTDFTNEILRLQVIIIVRTEVTEPEVKKPDVAQLEETEDLSSVINLTGTDVIKLFFLASVINLGCWQ
jgi:hypothetical protein